MRSIVLLSLLFVLLSTLSTAYGQGFTIGPSTNPAAVTQSSIDRVSTIADNFYNRWYTLDAACDPRAVFAVAYLYMTASAKKLITASYFDDGNKMVDFISTFAARYTYAFDTWESGDRNLVSLPWSIYFSHAASNRSDVTEDITIGMNAHINYDLGIAAYQQGYAFPQWRDDYYRVNDLMAMVDDNVTHALARYDPQFNNKDTISQAYFQASIDFVTSWRSNAYAQATSYQAAQTPLAVRTLQASNEVAATTAAQGMAIPYPNRTDADRKAYCQANHYPLVI